MIAINVVIIGGSGHFHYALEGIVARPELTLSAVAPGHQGEDIGGLLSECASLGLSPRIYADHRTMLDEQRADIAVVNPWYSHNAAVTIECLKRGLHVFSEKPLATELSHLAKVREAWKASGRSLGGMFDLRCAPWFQAIEQAISSGAIGRVRMLNGRKSYKLGTRGPLYRERAAYGGMIPWVGVHAIDWVLHLGGSCRGVCAMQNADCNRGHGELEMTAAVIMQLQDGVIATVTADYLRPDGSARHDDDRLLVTGTDGTLEAVDGKAYIEDRNARRPLLLPERTLPFLRFIDAIGTLDAERQAEDALEASRISLIARQSGDEGRFIET